MFYVLIENLLFESAFLLLIKPIFDKFICFLIFKKTFLVQLKFNFNNQEQLVKQINDLKSYLDINQENKKIREINDCIKNIEISLKSKKDNQIIGWIIYLYSKLIVYVDNNQQSSKQIISFINESFKIDLIKCANKTFTYF